jgi:hypothetical protein
MQMLAIWNPSTVEAEAGGSGVWAQPGLQWESESSLGHSENLSQKENKNKKTIQVSADIF